MKTQPPKGHATLNDMPRLIGFARNKIIHMKLHPDMPMPTGQYLNTGNRRIYDYYSIAEFTRFSKLFQTEQDKIARANYEHQIEKPPEGCAGVIELRSLLKTGFPRIKKACAMLQPDGWYKIFNRKAPYYNIETVRSVLDNGSVPKGKACKPKDDEVYEGWNVPQHTKRETAICRRFNEVNRAIATALLGHRA